ncbi:MAG: serine hydrolase [Anaerolineales bacterium]|nr:serine hydrolase [Anaerolineales bacterium]MCB9144273.1 serine hydrolase [Anaerolineales bacterium]
MKRIEEFIAGFEGKTISVAVQDLESGRESFINADVSMHPASTMKVPVMMEVFRQAEAGLLSLDEFLPIYNSFTSIADGSTFSLEEVDDSELTLYQRMGQNETIRELTRLMIVRSSNLASNILMDKVGAAQIDAFVKALGIQGMSVIRGLEDKKAYRLGMNNAASARSSTQMMKLIAEGKVVSRKVCDEMIEVMFGQEFNESIPALLPAGVKVAHKTGWSDDFFHDIGIIFPLKRKPYILSLFTNGFAIENEAHKCMAEVSKMVYNELIHDRR